ncbi:MAG TPA: excinuclease ABC subunit A, partial [Trichococcus sp.]|nr:excinuclease ABC subunit A [Trichococcus sp.]
DRSFLGEKVKVSSKSIGNSQVLNTDYVVRSEIEIVLIEMADQVATRLRKSGAKTQLVSLSIGYSINYIDQLGRTGFHQQLKIPPTNASSELVAHILMIFDQHYKDQSIRNVGVGAGNLIHTDFLQLDLFQDPDEQVNEQKKDLIVDSIRKKYGFRSLVRAVSLLEGGRAIARSSLVGGHAGGMAGLEEGEENAERTKKTDG